MPSASPSSRPAVYFIVGAGALVVLLATLSLWQLAAGIDGRFSRLWLASALPVHSQPAALDPPWINVLQGTKQYDVQGNELWNMEDRLLPDEHYLIAGNSAGLTNQVMSVINAIHVAILTDRTPILPFFYAVDYHLGPPELLTQPIPNLPFSDLFNLPLILSSLHSTTFGRRLRGLVDISEVLEIDRSVSRGGRGWPEQVGVEGAMMKLNCWTTWEAPYGFLRILRVDPTYTFLPPDAKPEVYHPTYQGLVKYLGVDANRTMVEEEVGKLNETQRGVGGLPGEWVACIDNLYFAFDAHSQPGSFMDAWSKTTPSSDDSKLAKAEDGPWRTVGQYAEFAEPLLEKVGSVLREVFGKEEGEEIPKYISVHMRHGDFLERCQNDPSHSSCFSQESFAAAVACIQASLLSEKELNVTEVLFTTDETNPDFYEHARERGWKWVDEELSLKIRRQWGDWYPTLVDKVLLAGGAGFVGTQDSTMSIFSANRVQYWNDGLTTFVDRYSPAE